MLDISNRVFTFIKDTRLWYLQYLNEGGYPTAYTSDPHKSSGIVAVYDSSLGMCPKKAALERNKIEPSHPSLAKLSLNDLHRMRSGNVAEAEWIATLVHCSFEEGEWAVVAGLETNGVTRGKIDAWLHLTDAINIAGQDYSDVLVEFKRTDSSIKDAYLFQLCSYLDKIGDQAIGKLILDHRHSIEEFTVVPVGDGFSISGWNVFDEQGRSAGWMARSTLVDETDKHLGWMKLISVNPRSWIHALPKGIESPLDSWQCHQNWVKSRGEAQFRCPYAGYCFGIAADTFAVENEKQSRTIVARLVTADDGRVFRFEVPEKE